MNWRILATFVACLVLTAVASSKNAPVLGFGEGTRGGIGGRVLMVTRLDDDLEHPTEGSLRWALEQKGPRIVKFAVEGDIFLKDRLMVKEPLLTIDGSDAPGRGVCIRGGSLMFRDTHDVLVQDVRIRLGGAPAARQRLEQHASRPEHSAGLDCVSLDDSERIVFDHCSLSWSCDEIFGIVRCREVTIQWCILSEPLADPSLHPYGDSHACPVNASASTLSVHHCLFAHFVFRGPQFEANDMRKQDGYSVRMEAVNNVIFDYERSGSRYGSGVEKDNGTAEGKSFQFQFLNNLYLGDSAAKLPVESITNHGVIPNARVYVSGNVLQVMTRVRVPERLSPGPFAHGKGPVVPGPGVVKLRDVMIEKSSVVLAPFWKPEEASPELKAQVGKSPLFRTSADDAAETALSAAARVLEGAGDIRHRDAVDRRVIDDVIHRRYGVVLHAEPRS